MSQANLWRYGVPGPLPGGIPLRAGPLTCTYAAGDLRDIAIGGRVFIRRIYVAVRDPIWATAPATLHDVEMVRRARSFAVRFRAVHRLGEVHFAWRGLLQGEEDGTLTYALDGEALEAFRSNRVGLCVLHADACAGLPCTVEHVDGSQEQGRFPEEISPWQPFFAMRAIRHQVAPGAEARILLEGDTFEMEDQRNWSDASFKTYSRPLALPIPFTLERGERVAQRVTVQALGRAPEPPCADPWEPVALRLGAQPASRLPRLGLGLPPEGAPLSPWQRERLRALRPAHLRAELTLSDAGWRERLAQANAHARDLDATLELALTLSPRAEEELAALAQAVEALQPPVGRWLLYGQGQPITPPGLAPLARRLLGPLAPAAQFAVGSNIYFTELNRGRPALEGADAVCWAMHPQVHASDHVSLMETLHVQGTIVENARRLYPGCALAVSPVTLGPRFNPHAPDLPQPGDPRQEALFGAAWLAGSLKYLAEVEADSVTYGETVGPHGVMPAEGEEVYPLYHLLAWLAAWREARVQPVTSSAPLRAVALALRQGRRLALLLANLTAAPQPVLLRPLAGVARLRRLNEVSAAWARHDPQAFAARQPERLPTAQGALALLLWPYETAWVEGLEMAPVDVS